MASAASWSGLTSKIRLFVRISSIAVAAIFCCRKAGSSDHIVVRTEADELLHGSDPLDASKT